MSPISLWLADYQLLAAALLLGVMLAIAALRQPAQRLAVAKSTLTALAALALLCALPGWSLIHLLGAPRAPTETIAAAPSDGVALAPSPATLAPPVAPDNPVNEPLNIQPSAPSEARAMPSQPINWTVWLITAYAAGSAAAILWLITGALLAHRVRRQATPAPPELQALLQQLCSEGKRAPQLLISPRITAPVALGLRRPTILLPPSALPLPPAQLLPILAHELAHLQHRDLHTLAATRLLLVLLWPQPLYWLLRRTIRLDQETLADAAAAARAGRLDYAQQLLAWASSASTQRPPRLAGAVGLWEGPSQLKRRIAVLLNEKFNVMRSCSRRWRAATVTILALFAIALSTVTLQPTSVASDQPIDASAESPSSAEQSNGDAAKGVDESQTSSSEKTTHRSVGVGAVVAVPLDPPKHQPNALEIHVVDENKQPLAGVEATLYSTSSQSSDAKSIQTLATDDAGNVVFAAVVPSDQITKFEKMKAAGEFIAAAPESYLVALKRPGLATALVYQSAGELALSGGKRTIMLRPALKLSGRVTDPEGKPVYGAIVTAGSWAGTRKIDGVNTATTDADGRYEFTDRATFNRDAARRENSFASFAATAVNPPASQKDPSAPEDPAAAEVSTLVVTHPDFAVTRIEGGDVPGSTDVQMLPAASIIGRVVKHGSSEPAAGVAVHAYGFPTVEGIDVNEHRLRSGHSAVTTTNADGVYRFSNLPAAHYDVWADSGATDLSDAPWVSRGVSGVNATPGSAPAAVADLVIGPPAVVRVQLVDADSGQAVQLPPGAIAQPFPGRVGSPQFQPIAVQRVPVSSDGVFEMRVLPGKSCSGVFVFPGKGQYEAIYQSDDDFEPTGEVFDLQPGEKANATLSVYSKARINEVRERDQVAYRLLQDNKRDEAMAAYTAIIADFPMHVRALHARANLHDANGDYIAALADNEAILKLAPNDAAAKYGVAKLLATIPVDELRDGERALELANQLVVHAGHFTDQSWKGAVLDIQAAAYAELGKFELAVAAQQAAMEFVSEERDRGMKERLERYKLNKPSRAPRQAKPSANVPAKKTSDQGAATSPPLGPLTMQAASLPPATRATGVFYAAPNPKVGPIQREALDLKMPLDSSWHLVPQPKIDLNAATLGDAVK